MAFDFDAAAAGTDAFLDSWDGLAREEQEVVLQRLEAIAAEGRVEPSSDPYDVLRLHWAQDGRGPTCPWCGEERFLNVIEHWPEEHAWMFDTCCETSHQDACEFAADSPREFGRWIAPHLGQPVRQTYHSTVEVDFIRLDYGLEVGPVKQAVAREFIGRHHRHNDPPAGWLWGLGCYNGSKLVAVLWVGRPVARALEGQDLVEVNRLCVNPGLDPHLVWNACSLLYGQAVKEAARRGYKRVITYTLETESADTLRAAGWIPVARTKGGSWNCPSRPRTDKAPTCKKVRWEQGCTKAQRKALRRAATVRAIFQALCALVS
jgi:hypothetical protein